MNLSRRHRRDISLYGEIIFGKSLRFREASKLGRKSQKKSSLLWSLILHMTRWEYLKKGSERLAETFLSMWRTLINLIFSLRTYRALSPDIQVRHRVNRMLRSRSPLSMDEWFERFWQAPKSSENIPKDLVAFLYINLARYTKLEIARVLPRDRLQEDLHFPTICWFDWEINFCNDFYKTFGVDISFSFDISTLSTIEDLVLFLNRQLLSVKYPPNQLMS